VRTYSIKRLITGHKLGSVHAGKVFVAVPSKYEPPYRIEYKDKSITIDKEDTPVLSNSFPDKFGRGWYTLNYYEWTEEKFNATAKQITMFGNGEER